MSEEIRKLQERKNRLLQSIEFTKQKKKQVIDIVHRLISELNNREISRIRYEEKLSRALNGKSAEEWVKYYDEYLDYYEYQIKLCEKLIKEEGEKKTVYQGWEEKPKRKIKIIPVLSVLIGIFLIGIIAFSIYSFGPAVVDKTLEIGVGFGGGEISFAEGVVDVGELVTERPELIVDLDSEVGIIEEDLIQYQAVVGKPVKWKKKFTTEGVTGFSVELPEDSEGVIVKSSGEDITEFADIGEKWIGKEIKVKVGGAGITGQAVGEVAGEQDIEIIYETPAPEIEFQEGNGVETEETEERISIDNLLSDLGDEEDLTGIEDQEILNEKIRKNVEMGILTRRKKLGQDFIVKEEIKIFEKVKDIQITGPDDVHYGNILSFVEIPETLKVGEESKIKLYQSEKDGIAVKQEIEITVYDSDENGLLDTVEWITPQLSDWGGYILIEISGAVHLNADKDTLNNIYEEVKTLDNNWSETINENEYVRVVFEEPLDNTKDITVFPRIVSGDPRIEVYGVGIEQSLAVFEDLIEGKNTIYLTNLIGQQDVFDLKVVGGSVEFDWIVDPGQLPFGNCDPDGASCGSDCGGVFDDNPSSGWVPAMGDCVSPPSNSLYYLFGSTYGEAGYFFPANFDLYLCPIGATSGDDCYCLDKDYLDCDPAPLVQDYEDIFNFTHVYFGGTSVIQISTCEELQGIGTTTGNLDDDYILTQNINCSNTSKIGHVLNDGGDGFKPINGVPFGLRGTFDGDGYEISGLYINRPFEDEVGLFGGTQGFTGSEIINVGLVNVNIVGRASVGGLVGILDEIIIRNSYVLGNVTGDLGPSYSNVGGLVGQIEAGIGEIHNSYFIGEVIGGSFVGGLVGKSDSGLINNSYFIGSVEGIYTRVGGLIGEDTGDTYNSYALGNVTGDSLVGGFAGVLTGDTYNSYALVDVTGTGTIGGFAGTKPGSIYDSYSVGKVIGGSTMGGFVGNQVGGSCSNSFYDSTVSGLIGDGCGGGVTGKTTLEMIDELTFTETDTVGLTTPWDFVNDPNDDEGDEDIWQINDSVTYPCFAWQGAGNCFAPVILLDDGEACSVDGDCLNDNCRIEIDSLNKFCAAAGNLCSEEDTLHAGYGFGEVGTNTNADWICYASDLSAQCTSSDNCNEYGGRYCDGIDWDGVGSSNGLDLGCSDCKVCGGDSSFNQGILSCSSNAISGTACSGGNVCDGGGSCVECVADTNCAANQVCVGDEFTVMGNCVDEYTCRDVENLALGTWSVTAWLNGVSGTCGDHGYNVPTNDAGDLCVRFNIHDGDSNPNTAGVTYNHNTDRYSPASSALDNGVDYNFIKDYPDALGNFVQMEPREWNTGINMMFGYLISEAGASSDGTSSIGCCDASTDCVDDSLQGSTTQQYGCYDTDTVIHNADSEGGDTDNDYCLDGVWYDCKENSDCDSGEVCTSNNCVALLPPEIVYISDIGGALAHGSVPAISRDLTEDITVAKMFEFYVWSESLTSLPGSGEVTDTNALLILDDGTTQRKSSDGGVASTCIYVETTTPPAGATAHSADNTYRYRCSVGMVFYDDWGTSVAQNWNVEAWIKDSLNQEEGYIFGTRTYANSGNSESQYARTTYFNRLEEYKITPAANLDFGDVVYGLQTTKPTTNPLKIVNIGNYDIDRVDVIGYNIPGSVRSGELILSEWFRSSSASSVCTTGLFLDNGVTRQVITSNIVPGPSSESNLEFCLTDVQVSAGQQAYQTTVNPWNLEGVYTFILSIINLIKFNFEFTILLSVVAVRVKKKNKLKKKLRLSEEDILELDNVVRERYNIGLEELLASSKQKEVGKELEIQIPVAVFKQELSPAEALAKYLKENMKMRFAEIARLINRDERTIWINYRDANNKMERKIKVEKEVLVSIEIFSDRRLSVLESVVYYFKEKGFRNIEIAEMLGKDQRNISTLYSRVKKKLSIL